MDLLKVTKPGRYTGGEYGTPTIKADAQASFCMCFPDLYEVGMSNLGTRILYYMLNDMESVKCERAYAPWLDYKEQLGDGLLTSLETKTLVKDFDFVGFSFQFELCYTTFLYMLDVAGIPYKSKDRGEEFPIIIGGGPCCVNPEPIADFCDLIVVGEAEDVLKKIMSSYVATKGISKKKFIEYCSRIDGVYVPSLATLDDKGYVNNMRVARQFVRQLDDAYFPKRALVPSLEIVHDRAVVELFRGCSNGCRFCQAGFIYRPVRERSVDKLYDICTNLIQNTGYDELSLNSLSTGDYSQLKPLYYKLKAYADDNKVQLALPSLRLDSFDGTVSESSRKSSLTFAPEAGTQRLRDVINKNISEEDFERSMMLAFSQGYSTVKLYFMIGLPTETMEDIDGIVQMAIKVKHLFNKYRSNKKGLRINVSVSTFIPKPFTPFEFEALDNEQNVELKQSYLREKLKSQSVSFSYHDYKSSLLEAAFARGDRRLGDVLLLAYRKGAYFDGWSEQFKFNAYMEAFNECGVDINKIVDGYNVEERLPWDFVDIGVTREFLINQRKLAYEATTTAPCSTKCSNCGMYKEGLCK